MRIGHPKNFWGGMIFAAVGFMFAIIAYGLSLGDNVIIAGYAMGTPARMGPGFFPFWLGAILCALGLAIALGGLLHKARGEGALERFHWKEICFVIGAIVVFGVFLHMIGMLLAGMVLIVGASLGSATFNLRKSFLLGVILVTFSALVFVAGLKLPIPLCPDLESLQSFGICRA